MIFSNVENHGSILMRSECSISLPCDKTKVVIVKTWQTGGSHSRES